MVKYENDVIIFENKDYKVCVYGEMINGELVHLDFASDNSPKIILHNYKVNFKSSRSTNFQAKKFVRKELVKIIKLSLEHAKTIINNQTTV